MTINEWDTWLIPRSTVLLVVHEYILVPVASRNPRSLLGNGAIGLEDRVLSPCPPRIEWVSPPLSELPRVRGGGLNPVLPSHCLPPGLTPLGTLFPRPGISHIWLPFARALGGPSPCNIHTGPFQGVFCLSLVGVSLL